MCLFSQAVRHVSKTRIFARAFDDERQLLVYTMRLTADQDLAMVLPIPVPPSSPEDAVRFVDLSSCPAFFDGLDELFLVEHSRSFGVPAPAFVGAPQARLVVHDVGDFEASFVPTRRDFDRLDPRFRLSSDVWDALPAYADWGFCVFKLRAKAQNADAAGAAAPAASSTAAPEAATAVAAATDEHGASAAAPVQAGAVKEQGIFARVLSFFGRDTSGASAGAPAFAPAMASPSSTPPREFHPMAFEFPRRDRARLFFPTIHVHDGAVHESAHFDHTLYCQLRDDASPPRQQGEWWERSMKRAGRSLRARSLGCLSEGHVHRCRMVGDLPNRDVFVEGAPT